MLVRDVQPGVVRIDLRGRNWERTVSVLTDGSRPCFPHPVWDSGQSTGDAELDQAVRSYVKRQLAVRAAERPRPRGRRL
jgi:hypothetical protein